MIKVLRVVGKAVFGLEARNLGGETVAVQEMVEATRGEPGAGSTRTAFSCPHCQSTVTMAKVCLCGLNWALRMVANVPTNLEEDPGAARERELAQPGRLAAELDPIKRPRPVV